MTIWIASIGTFFGLLFLQTGLVASLPWPFNTIPVLYAATIYLIQHMGWTKTAWWLVAYGLWLDVFGIGTVPVETLVGAATAGCVLLLSKKYFSNRSWYAVIVCGLATLLFKDLLSVGLLAIAAIGPQTSVAWGMHVGMFVWEAIFSLVLFGVLFQCAPVLRTLARSFRS